MASRRRKPRTPPAGPRGGPQAEASYRDAETRQAVLLERVKAALAKEVRGWWDDAADDIAAAVVARLGPGAAVPAVISRAIEAELGRVVGEIVAAAAVGSGAVISDGMRRIARIEATWAVQALEPTLPIGVSLRMPPLNQIRGLVESERWKKFGPEKATRPLVDWTQGLERAAKAEVRQVVREALRTGMPVDEAKRAIRRTIEVTSRQAEAIARTGFSHAAGVGAQMFAEENVDVAIGVLWVSTLDSRTTITCAALDGSVFLLDEGPRPPAHFNCRSRVSILTRSAEDILAGRAGKPTRDDLAEAVARRQGQSRASIDYNRMTGSPVSAGETYGTWLRRQPAAVQDDVLGKTRGRMFRSGQVQIEQFVGSDYQPLPLRDLERRLGIGS